MTARLREEAMEGWQERPEKPRPIIVRCELNNSSTNFLCWEMWYIGKMSRGELFVHWVDRVLKNDPVASQKQCWVNCGFYEDRQHNHEKQLQLKKDRALRRKYIE